MALLTCLAMALTSGLTAYGDMANTVLWELRLPRVLLAAFCGASFALAGLLMQDFFRNPLVEPGLLGVSAGASLAAVGLMALGAGALWLLPVAAFVGALTSLALVLLLSRRLRAHPAELLLVGVAVNALAAALVNLLLSLGDASLLRGASFWLMGSFAQADYQLLLPASLLLALVAALIWRQRQALDVWLLGEQEAAHLGVDVTRLRRLILISAAVLVALAVAQAGGIAFIGLLAPHMARRLGRVRHRELLPASIIIGALLAVLADGLARQLLAPLELPVGVLTAMVGAPAFLLLFLRSPRP